MSDRDIVLSAYRLHGILDKSGNAHYLISDLVAWLYKCSSESKHPIAKQTLALVAKQIEDGK